MDPDDLLGLGSSIVAAVIVGAFSLLAVRHSLRAQERSEVRSRADEAERVMRKYRDPLAHSAFDLQSRLYNIVANDFLGKYLVRGTPSEKEYALESTLYVIGEYFGWVEILRRENQFLDLGDIDRNRMLSELLAGIGAIFLSERLDRTLRVFRAEQRAIGEVMMTREVSSNRECIGYADFVRRRQEPGFAHWFERLRGDVELLAAEPGMHLQRVVELQQELIDLLDFLDPERQYFAERHRGKLADRAGEPSAHTHAPTEVAEQKGSGAIS